jgi:hypothetical protein
MIGEGQQIEIDVLYNIIPEYTEDLKAKIRDHVRDSAQELFAEAQSTVPYDTGYLHSTGELIRVGPIEYWIQYTADYAEFVHEGTRYQDAQPWLEQAAEFMYPIYVRGLERIIDG